ncbi:crotonobetaine/carnitine-CoA ligase [Stackebrandtia endophytica]|uniref:Crotonobetaine/carnitine-CoA ligase n=1 Tax=Stackebrandtia endophytica TaxID=1496996 RepID=A0A543AVU8_9ACTN|nr:AMP-binding protein [Stackebrandtia endophytica]TQL76662.1 crotonobetaine/carnitine-CoA ligase [Stackebrandtia endophytica]
MNAIDLPDHLDADHSLVLPTLLRDRARRQPDETFLHHTEGGSLTHGQLERRVRQWMSRLHQLKVGAGHRVMTLLPPSFDAVAMWLATARLGAVEMPVNTALRGEFLAHIMRDGEPQVVVVAPHHLCRLAELRSNVTIVVADSGIERIDEYDGPDYSPRPHDVSTMVYTSGTSGRSKGVVVPWGQQYATARWLMPMEGRERDVWYGPWAMFHVSGKVGLYSSALLNGQLVLRNGFSTSNFWQDVQRFSVTSTMIVASTVAFLDQAEPSPSDRDHSLRNVCAAPMPPDPAAFAHRFGIRLSTLFNMTETASPIVTGWDDFPARSCGRARPGIETRIVDEHGDDVPVGQIGELLLRSRAPHEIMAGYWRAPQATVDAWRDLWFHTGDAVRQDADGDFYFIDRLKDTIRRGGENISSAELEAVVNGHPAVCESAAVGIPTPWNDRDVKLFVVPMPGFDAGDLAAYLDERLPRFMRPSVISVLDVLPKTHTARVKKSELRALNDEPVWTRPDRRSP